MKSRVFFLVAAALVAAGCLSAKEIAAPEPGPGAFEFTRAGKTIPVYYYVPSNATAETPVVIAMHGVKRDGKRYRDDWQAHAEKYGFLLLAPEFSEEQFPGSKGYTFGGMGEKNGQATAMPKDSSYRFIEPAFQEAKRLTGNRSKKFYLYGHSAGAQFVHRYFYFVPQAPIQMAVAANAGWWTMPDFKVEMPYGLGGSPLNEDSLAAALQRPLVVLLGTEDTDPNHPELRKTPEAEAQGPHRWARGHKFYEEARKRAAKLKVPFAWKLGTAPGVAHSDKGMSNFAVKWFFGQ